MNIILKLAILAYQRLQLQACKALSNRLRYVQSRIYGSGYVYT